MEWRSVITQEQLLLHHMLLGLVCGSLSGGLNSCYNVGQVTGTYPMAFAYGGSNTNYSNLYNAAAGICFGTFSNGSMSHCHNLGLVEGKDPLFSSCSGSGYSNLFYLTGSQASSYGTAKTRAEMISTIEEYQNFKADIGINDGLPILSWQTNNDKLNLINGENAFVADTNNVNGGYPLLAWE